MAGAEQLLQLTLVGLTQGAIYALIALGFVTIYNVTGIINFAQGQFAMLGAMVLVSFGPLGLPRPLAVILAVTAVALVGGLVERPLELGLEQLRAMPSRTQITRHDCVEGWSCIGKWTGVPLALVLEKVGLKPEAQFIVFTCADE